MSRPSSKPTVLECLEEANRCLSEAGLSQSEEDIRKQLLHAEIWLELAKYRARQGNLWGTGPRSSDLAADAEDPCAPPDYAGAIRKP